MTDVSPHAIEFRVSRGAHRLAEVEPFVDGVSLRDLVGAFERERRYEPSGAYSGLVPAYFNFGDFAAYLLGEEPRQWPEPGRLWLLACDCGEVGCWPLEASVAAAQDYVRWSDFRQPHRPQWAYNGFGPFGFERGRYEAAIAEAVNGLRDGVS